MSAEDREDVVRMRRLRAVALVIAVILVVPGIDMVVRVASQGRAGPSVAMGLDARQVVGAGDAFTAIERLEQAGQAPDVQLTEPFEEEVGLLPGARDVRANDDGSVVGYTVDEDADEAFALLDERMLGKGWTGVPLGEVEGATYVKEAGSCHWALVTCIPVGEATSVVVRTAVT